MLSHYRNYCIVQWIAIIVSAMNCYNCQRHAVLYDLHCNKKLLLLCRWWFQRYHLAPHSASVVAFGFQRSKSMPLYHNQLRIGCPSYQFLHLNSFFSISIIFPNLNISIYFGNFTASRFNCYMQLMYSIGLAWVCDTYVYRILHFHDDVIKWKHFPR